MRLAQIRMKGAISGRTTASRVPVQFPEVGAQRGGGEAGGVVGGGEGEEGGEEVERDCG